MKENTKRHPISDIMAICNYFRISNPVRINEIKTLINNFEEIENSYSSLCTFQNRSFIYVSPTFQSITGYPMEKIAIKGYDFFMSITAKESIPYIMMRQAQYIKQINTPNFKYLKPNAVEFDASFIHRDNELVPVSQVSVMLNYEPGGDINTFFAIWICINGLSKSELREKKSLLWKMLTDLHRLIFSPRSLPREKKMDSDFLISLKTPLINVPKLSNRERELLVMLSKGKALKEAASVMKINYTTAETYRKNLFKKFETKSVAALIRKASKVYWLE